MTSIRIAAIAAAVAGALLVSAPRSAAQAVVATPHGRVVVYRGHRAYRAAMVHPRRYHAMVFGARPRYMSYRAPRAWHGHRYGWHSHRPRGHGQGYGRRYSNGARGHRPAPRGMQRRHYGNPGVI